MAKYVLQHPLPATVSIGIYGALQHSMLTETAIALRGVSKVFDGFYALDGVDMDIQSGTLHAILGENGAGKTTLMNVLFGLYQPDQGSIRLRGEKLKIASPQIAMQMGIGMIHQHFMLVDSLSAVENVALGLPNQGMILKLDTIAQKLQDLCAEYNFDVDVDEAVWKLPLGMRQRIEILKVLIRNASIIILDEPTSVLAPNEIKQFLEGMRRLKNRGKTIIFITHKLDEVMSVADRVTIMQHGKVWANLAVADTHVKQLASLMVGRDLAHSPLQKSDSDTRTNQKPIVFRAEGLNAHNAQGVQALKEVSIHIRAGEVLAIAGVDGNGQAELAKAIVGLLKLDSGRIKLQDADITNASVYERCHRHKIAYVPEDRHHTGLVLDFSIAQNVALRDFDTPRFSKKGLLDFAAIGKKAAEWVQKYDVRMRSIDQQVRFLSGGNQQKLIFAREVERDPQLLVVMQPCKGLDVGAIEAVQQTILAARANGKAILYISTELEDIMRVADRIAVMSSGRITGELRPDEVTDEKIGALMGGIQQQKTAC